MADTSAAAATISPPPSATPFREYDGISTNEVARLPMKLPIVDTA